MTNLFFCSGGQGVTIYPATRYLFGVSALSVQGHSEHDSVRSRFSDEAYILTV
jgi:hypothetical protein